MPLLYFFCQYGQYRGEQVLRFGQNPTLMNTIKVSQLPRDVMKDQPLVFANACTTSAGDPYIANELEQLFFRRGCSAYLGTETKIPIRFASRFAAIFFHFFYRDWEPSPMAAGEAITLTRQFLWSEYRNIGGILYSYINQYELFMADEAEILALYK